MSEKEQIGNGEGQEQTLWYRAGTGGTSMNSYISVHVYSLLLSTERMDTSGHCVHLDAMIL